MTCARTIADTTPTRSDLRLVVLAQWIRAGLALTRAAAMGHGLVGGAVALWALEERIRLELEQGLKGAGMVDADLHFHDLRGTAATRMYLGCLTIREIAEVMTWGEDEVERLVDRYVKRDELLRDRIRRMDEAAKPGVSER